MSAPRRYAANTAVPIERSRAEISRVLTRHGATGFIFGETHGQALIAFEMRARRLRFIVPMPVAREDKERKFVAAEQRRRYRALLLVLKAKLEAVASEIVEFDEEFLAHIVVEGSTTVGDRIVPTLGKALATGKLPPLLGPGGAS